MRKRGKGITGAFISDLVLQILAYVAEKEREMILQRQREGIASAKMRGVKFGQPKKIKPQNYDLVFGEWQAGRISARAAGESWV